MNKYSLRDMNTDGFLSPETERFSKDIKSDYQPWFAVIYNINRIGQRVMLGAKLKNASGFSTTRAITMLLLTRSLSNMQGAILMLERGMIVESQTLIRACIENAFCMAALMNEPDRFIETMQENETANHLKLLRFFLEGERLDSETKERFQAYHESLNGKLSKKPKRFNVDQISKMSVLKDYYAIYTKLSSQAAHPTFSALMLYVGQPHHEHQIIWGPAVSYPKIKETFSWVYQALGTILTIATSVFEDEENKKALASTIEDYEKLLYTP